jgi:hypothetical protein
MYDILYRISDIIHQCICNLHIYSVYMSGRLEQLLYRLWIIHQAEIRTLWDSYPLLSINQGQIVSVEFIQTQYLSSKSFIYVHCKGYGYGNNSIIYLVDSLSYIAICHDLYVTILGTDRYSMFAYIVFERKNFGVGKIRIIMVW